MKILHFFLTVLLLSEEGVIRSFNVLADIDFAYTCVVYTDDKPKCTGTLISRMWVLTTCLCIKDLPSTRVYVRIGDPYMQTHPKHKFYTADKIEIHPACISSDNKYHPENDLAMIMLNEPFFDSRNVIIIKMPHQLMFWTPDSELDLDLVAWADLTDSADTLDTAAWYHKTKIVDPAECQKQLRDRDYKAGATFCAYYWHKDGKNDCELDIGAPLGYEYILIGLLIHKERCGKEGEVGSFVNIPMHSQWIRDTSMKNTPWIMI